MCRYIYHHFGCGHICCFTIESCFEFLNLLRRASQPGSDSPKMSCANIFVDHVLFRTKQEFDCLQCELDSPDQDSANEYIPIEGLKSADPIITAKMQWLVPKVPKSRKREFDDAFLDLDLDGDHEFDGDHESDANHESDRSDASTVQPSTITNVSPSASEIFYEFFDVPLHAHDHDTADEAEEEVEDEDEEDYGPGPAKKRKNSISEDYMVIDTDMPNTQAERVTSQAKGEEDSEDDFYSLWLPDSESDDETEDTTGPIMRFGNTDDDTQSIRRQLETFTFTRPVPRSTPRTPDSPPCSPRTRPHPHPRPRPRPERLPLYVGFPGQSPEKSPLTRWPLSRGNYVDARTELQSPVFDGFPGTFPDEDELGLRSPGLVSFPRFVEEKEKSKSTGMGLGLRRARLAFCSGRAAVLKGLNMVKPRE